MLLTLENHPQIADACLEVAKTFSQRDLQPHPNTDAIMGLFTENAEFIGETFFGLITYNVGKWVAERVFKHLCEDGVLELHLESDPTFEVKEDHIVWSSTSIQLRQGILPTAPEWLRIHFVSKLYFEQANDGIKISKYECVVNDRQPCAPYAKETHDNEQLPLLNQWN